MGRAQGKKITRDQQVRSLIDASADCEGRSCISELLHHIAGAVGADGCILWRIAPYINPDKIDSTKGGLFVFAQWFNVPAHSSVYNLSFESATGEAVLTGKAVVVKDAAADPRVDRTEVFSTAARIRSFYSEPITFPDGSRGALTLYFREVEEFPPEKTTLIEQLTGTLIKLYQRIQDTQSYHLLSKTNNILYTSRASPPGTWNDFRPLVELICTELAKAFNALEVSLFLCDPIQGRSTYRLMATTWPVSLEKDRYEPSKNDGLTGWVLENKKSILIFDLAHFQREESHLKSIYTGIIWADSLKIRESFRELVTLPHGVELQPLSYMAVPVLSRGRLLGAVRCCTARKAPYYFSNDDLALLRLVADQIGQCWNQVLHHWRLSQENEAWNNFMNRLEKLNNYVQQQAGDRSLDEKNIFQITLDLLSDVIFNAEISDIRLLDQGKSELFFEAVHGDAWNLGSPDQISARLSRRFPVNRVEPGSAGAWVVLNNSPLLILDTAKPETPYSPTFPGETRRMIIAPISIPDEVFGVLDIRGTGGDAFPRYALTMAGILGQQLGMYHFLIRSIESISNLHREQAQTFEDLNHQLKSPVLQIRSRTQDCVSLLGEDSDGFLYRELLALRGLASKARRVSLSLGLFADLARGRTIRVKKRRLTRNTLVKLLIEACQDQESTLDPQTRPRFEVRISTFDDLGRMRVEVDIDLLSQAVTCLLDNAGKYSFPRTTVSITGGLTKRGRFHITVVNQGLTISASDIESCKHRGWRSPDAMDVTGEGSGIGLWIVDNVMEAMNGMLLISPTSDHSTEVKLVFPVLASTKGESFTHACEEDLDS